MAIFLLLPPIDSVEGLYVWLQTVSLIFLVGTIVTGAGTIITGYVLNLRQTAKIANLEAANIEAQRSLESERKIRLEMELDLAPRRIPLIDHGGVTNIDPL